MVKIVQIVFGNLSSIECEQQTLRRKETNIKHFKKEKKADGKQLLGQREIE